MKKLTYEQIKENVLSNMDGYDVHFMNSKEGDLQEKVMYSIIEAIVDSINENIGESWVDKIVYYDGQRLQVSEIFTGNRYEFRENQEFKCTKDYGADITVMNSGNTFNVPKEWMKIK